jgi:hypothetical protein
MSARTKLPRSLLASKSPPALPRRALPQKDEITAMRFPMIVACAVASLSFALAGCAADASDPTDSNEDQIKQGSNSDRPLTGAMTEEENRFVADQRIDARERAQKYADEIADPVLREKLKEQRFTGHGASPAELTVPALANQPHVSR